jgi:hypothetical protein
MPVDRTRYLRVAPELDERPLLLDAVKKNKSNYSCRVLARVLYFSCEDLAQCCSMGGLGFGFDSWVF